MDAGGIEQRRRSAGKFKIAGNKRPFAGRRLTAMVNDLLDVSKIEEGRFGYQFDNVEIISFVEQALSGAAALAQEFGIKIYFDKPAEPSIVLRIDQQKIGMVLSNLLDNAIKYNIKNGR